MTKLQHIPGPRRGFDASPAASEMRDMIAAQIEAAQQVIDNWSQGDLAGAVNALEEVTETARATIARTQRVS